MKPYTFSDEFSRKIVDGLRLGYLDYVEERGDKNKTMIVSNGYAWTRANHIEDQLNKQFLDDDRVTAKITSTSSWKFVCFHINIDGHYIWLVQKPQQTVDSKYLGKSKNGKRKMISQWGETFNSNFQDLFKGHATEILLFETSQADERALDNMQQQGSTSEDSPEAVYLLTYTINDDKEISAVRINLFYNSQVKEIMNLSELNSSSTVVFPQEILDKIDKKDIIDPKTEESMELRFYQGTEQQKKHKNI